MNHIISTINICELVYNGSKYPNKLENVLLLERREMDRYIVTWFISKSPQGDSVTDHPKTSPSHHRFWSNSQYRVALATEYPMWNYRFIESKVLDLYPLKLFRVVWKFSKFPTLRSIIFLQNINRYQLVYISDSSQLELCIYTNKIKNI